MEQYILENTSSDSALLKITCAHFVSKRLKHIYTCSGSVHVQMLWQNVIAKFELREFKYIDWVNIHLGLSGNSQRIKIFNTIIFAMKYWIYMQGKVRNIVFGGVYM